MQRKETLEKELNRIVATLIQEYQPQEKSSSSVLRLAVRYIGGAILIYSSLNRPAQEDFIEEPKH